MAPTLGVTTVAFMDPVVLRPTRMFASSTEETKLRTVLAATPGTSGEKNVSDSLGKERKEKTPEQRHRQQCDYLIIAWLHSDYLYNSNICNFIHSIIR